MYITKTVSKTYEIKFYPDALPGMTWGSFKKSREKIGMNNSKLKRCFCCNHEFDENESVIVISVSGIGNRFACRMCLEREENETK